jgi:MFS transporter, OFA family, oxalate/formate antiporter
MVEACYISRRMAQSTSSPPIPTVDEGDAGSSGIFFGYWLVGAAFIAQFVSVGAQNYVAGVFLRPMTADLDWTRGEFALSRTIGQLVMAVTGFYIGAHVDRRGGRRVMLIGTTVLVAALWATSYIQDLSLPGWAGVCEPVAVVCLESSLWQWLVLNGVVLTAGGAMMGNLVVNVTLSKWFVAKRGRMVGFAAMGVSFAGVALTPGMAWVVTEWDWRLGWQVMAVGSALLVYPVAFLMRRAPEDYGMQPDGAKGKVSEANVARAAAEYATSLTRSQALRTPSFYLMVLSFALITLSIPVLLQQTIPFLQDADHSQKWAAFMITVASIPALLVKPVWGLFIDKTEPKLLVALSAVITGASIIWLVLAVAADSEALIMGGFVLLGIGWGGMIPLQEVTWASYFGRRHLGAIRSAGLPLSIALGASATYLVALYFDKVGDYNGAFYVVAGCCFVAAVMVMFVRKPVRTAVG